GGGPPRAPAPARGGADRSARGGEARARHSAAYGDSPIYRSMLDVGGEYAFRLRGEDHAWTPETIKNLQHAVRGNLPERYREFAKAINDQSERLLTIRGLMQFRLADRSLPLGEVEPAAEIVKPFPPPPMSLRSIHLH